METSGKAEPDPNGKIPSVSSEPGFLMGGAEAARYSDAGIGQSAIAMVVTDLDDVVRVWSAGAERLLGYRADEIVGRPHRMLIPDDLVDTDERELTRRALAGEQVLYFATDMRARDGRRISVEVCRSIIRDVRGTPMGVSTVILDQTEKRAMQEKILQTERMNALARVVGKVFHELRTPLGVLVLQAEILAEEIDDLIESARGHADPTLAKRLHESLEIFTREIQRIEGLAEDYLLMIRPIRAHPSPVRLGEFMETLKSELAVKSRRPGYEVRVLCGSPDEIVRLDPLQILRVFHNLAMNSLDAVPEEKAPRLTIAADLNGRELTLSLKDNGPGLPPELRDGAAFEIFATTKRQGSGLGLHLVQEIILAHGGRITLANHPEGGAEAVVRFPAGGPPKDA